MSTIAREVNGKVCLGITHGVIENQSGNPMAAATPEEEIGLYKLFEDSVTSIITSIAATATTKRTNSNIVANTSSINHAS